MVHPETLEAKWLVQDKQAEAVSALELWSAGVQLNAVHVMEGMPPRGQQERCQGGRDLRH